MAKYLKIGDTKIGEIFDASWDNRAPYTFWHRLTVPEGDAGYIKSLLAQAFRTHAVHYEVSTTRGVFYLAPKWKFSDAV